MTLPLPVLQFTPEVPKKPAEGLDLTMDFSLNLAPGVTITGCPSWVCTVKEGVDHSPNAMISGSPIIAGSKVTQHVVGGLYGLTYDFKATVTLSQGGPLIGEGILAMAAHA